MTKNGQDRNAMKVGHADAPIEPADLRVVPANREENWRIQQITEVVGVVGVLPKVIRVHYEVSPERLLETGMEFVALTCANRPRGPAKDRVQQWITGYAGDDQILVERGFEDAGIRGAENRVTGFNVVGNPDTRFDLRLFGEASI